MQIHHNAIALVIFGLFSAAANGDEKRSDRDIAVEYLRDVEALCKNDNGRLWGVSLSGPMMFVEPKSRRIYANQADLEGLLKKDGDVYIGELPKAVIVANYSLKWAGVQWTMVRWPLPADQNARRVLMLHESWHRIQARVGLPQTGPENLHLDRLNGRFWLQLEWRALTKALSERGDKQQEAIADALAFRTFRRTLCMDSAQPEQQLEMHEGMAEYTGVVLSGMSDEDRLRYTVKLLENGPEQFASFPRSFASLSGPAYGLLLDQVRKDWRSEAKPDTDLGEILRIAHKLVIPELKKDALLKRAERYDGNRLLAKETERERVRLERQAELSKRFVDGPMLTLPLKKSNFSFDPNTVVPLDKLGVFYPTMRVVDAWGILDVTGGAVRATDFQSIRVVAPKAATGSPLKGDGWELQLADGWRLVPGKRAGDFQAQPREVNEQLLAADRAFARATAEKGLDGWMSFLAADAARTQRPGEKLTAGTDAIRKQDAAIFADPKRQLVWEPVDAHAFADGKSGVTSGRYRVVSKDGDGKEKTLSAGGYVTWWRQEADGLWKVIFDTGSPDDPLPKRK